MNLYNTFATDKNLERDGIVLDYGKNSKNENVQIRIARAGGSNARFAKVLEFKMKPYKRVGIEGVPNDVAEKILVETYAETVVLGWEGVEDKEGNPLEFNKANVVKLFTDLPDLFSDIQQQSQKFSLFREELREADSGNSQQS